MSTSGWINFWTAQKQSFDGTMKISTAFFALQLDKLFKLKPTDEIFDYGCGPGFLADYLTTKQLSFVGADINKSFIEESKKKHSASQFIHIVTDLEANKRILSEQVKGREFDFIVLLSITQYFKDAAELENVIKMMRPYVRDNGKIIIADVIDQNTSSFRDAVSLLLHCIGKGKIIVFLRFMLYLIFSNYRKLSMTVKLLRLSEQSMEQIAENNLLNCKKVNGLTIHSTRTNYVLTKKS